MTTIAIAETLRSSKLVDAAKAFAPALFEARGDVLAAAVGRSGKIEDHKFGRVSGAEASGRFVDDFQAWLKDWEIEKVVHLRTTDAGARVVSEDIIFMTSPDGKKIEWPFATFAKTVDGTDDLEFLVYYTIWPIIERHTKRPVIFERPEIDTEPNDVLKAYHKCLTSGDLLGLHNVMAPDAYIRESSGPPYAHLGLTSVVGYFKGLFADGAPMMRTERLTSDGRCTWIEFSVIGWNGTPWPEADHQAGAGVWQMNEDNLMCAVRVYDDIEF